MCTLCVHEWIILTQNKNLLSAEDSSIDEGYVL